MAEGDVNKLASCGTRGSHFYKDGNGYADQLRMTEDRLSEEAKNKRRVFAIHYVKTMNATSAAEFAGFASPHQKGYKMLREPYVQELISDLLKELEKDAIMTQNEVLFRFKYEAMNLEAGNQSARVAALGHIAKIHGMLIDKQETKVDTNGGVMVVPAMPGADDWGAMAAKSQAELKKDVKQ